jgi:hypothetical protein
MTLTAVPFVPDTVTFLYRVRSKADLGFFQATMHSPGMAITHETRVFTVQDHLLK